MDTCCCHNKRRDPSCPIHGREATSGRNSDTSTTANAPAETVAITHASTAAGVASWLAAFEGGTYDVRDSDGNRIFQLATGAMLFRLDKEDFIRLLGPLLGPSFFGVLHAPTQQDLALQDRNTRLEAENEVLQLEFLEKSLAYTHLHRNLNQISKPKTMPINKWCKVTRGKKEKLRPLNNLKSGTNKHGNNNMATTHCNNTVILPIPPPSHTHSAPPPSHTRLLLPSNNFGNYK